MSNLILYTSGSTKEPKEVVHQWANMYAYAVHAAKELEISTSDIVFNVFPPNVIAYYTITAIPAQYSGATLINSNFDPYSYIRLFKKYSPTIIALIPRHYELLKATKDFDSLDMGCVRYMVTGSTPVSQEMIDDFRNRGVQTVGNWYGMTEQPPPVFVGRNSVQFDFDTKGQFIVDFTDEGECIVNGFNTGDIFDVENRIFLRRKEDATRPTWKTNF